MSSNQITRSSRIPPQDRQLAREALRNQICLYWISFVSYTIFFGMIIWLNFIYDFSTLGSILCVYLSTSVIFGTILYIKARIRYRSLYISVTWNQMITKEEVQNVLQRKHNITHEEALDLDKGNNNPEEFCFCMDDKEDTEIVKLDCNHIFHTSCLAEWLISNNSCPNCRVTNIINRNDFV